MTHQEKLFHCGCFC